MEKTFRVCTIRKGTMKTIKVLLTYVDYSDELTFEKGKAKRIPLKNQRRLKK